MAAQEFAVLGVAGANKIQSSIQIIELDLQRANRHPQERPRNTQERVFSTFEIVAAIQQLCAA